VQEGSASAAAGREINIVRIQREERLRKTMLLIESLSTSFQIGYK
jgi:hypothetical protein